MQLLSNRVLVTLVDEEVITPGGIVVPKTVSTLATVKVKIILLGESKYGEWWINVGDTVNMDNPNFAAFPMNYIDFEGEECIIANENDLNYVL